MEPLGGKPIGHSPKLEVIAILVVLLISDTVATIAGFENVIDGGKILRYN